MIDIRQPNITAEEPLQQVAQMRSYMYQLSQQLQWAFNNIGSMASSGSGGVVYSQKSGGGSSGGMDDKTALDTFAGLKGLIIKSADIVNAYYDTIQAKLEGLYVAQSEFGEYVEATKLELEANSKGITQNYENIQGIQTSVKNTQTDISVLQSGVTDAKDSVENVRNELAEVQQGVDDITAIIVETNAYIKSGHIYDDENGIPVYGLEIGQTNTVNGEQVFDKFARFSSGRLSFFDSNETEVAYISDYKLYITNAEITGSLRIVNRFKIYYDNGLAFKWIGGGDVARKR